MKGFPLRNTHHFIFSKDLSWRDVQHIIIRTARPDPVYGVGHDWRTNQAGLKCKHFFLVSQRMYKQQPTVFDGKKDKLNLSFHSSEEGICTHTNKRVIFSIAEIGKGGLKFSV